MSIAFYADGPLAAVDDLVVHENCAGWICKPATRCVAGMLILEAKDFCKAGLVGRRSGRCLRGTRRRHREDQRAAQENDTASTTKHCGMIEGSFERVNKKGDVLGRSQYREMVLTVSKLGSHAKESQVASSRRESRSLPLVVVLQPVKGPVGLRHERAPAIVSISTHDVD